MILPKVRAPRFITVRRGGTLQDDDHRMLAIWAADCAQHVLRLFEEIQPNDKRPRQAIESAYAWVRGEITVSQFRAAGGRAMAAARSQSGAARYAAYAAGQAAVVAHVAAQVCYSGIFENKPRKKCISLSLPLAPRVIFSPASDWGKVYSRPGWMFSWLRHRTLLA